MVPSMARPREFDRDEVLERAMSVFWSKGFTATSTSDLVEAMQIGRQSMYDSFGDKRALYLEALAQYQQQSVTAHIGRLRSGKTALAGIEAMLAGLAPLHQVPRHQGRIGDVPLPDSDAIIPVWCNFAENPAPIVRVD